MGLLRATRLPLAREEGPRTQKTIACCFDHVPADGLEQVLRRDAVGLFRL